jgi:hypothetical protein
VCIVAYQGPNVDALAVRRVAPACWLISATLVLPFAVGVVSALFVTQQAPRRGAQIGINNVRRFESFDRMEQAGNEDDSILTREVCEPT